MTDTLTRKRPSQVSPPSIEPPVFIASDHNKMALWDQANEDERFLAVALCELESHVNHSGIESFFRFADQWHQRVCSTTAKGENKNYKKGLASVKNGAELSPYSVSQVYCILRTIKVYSRQYYTVLARKAGENGATINWTHLRTLAERLGNPEFKMQRREIEEKLVRGRITVKQLNQMIDEQVPETVKAKEKTSARKEGRALLGSCISTFKKTVSQQEHWLKAFERFEEEFQGDDPNEVQATLRQVRAALELFDRTSKFLEQSRPILEMLQQEVSFLANAPDENSGKTKSAGMSGSDEPKQRQKPEDRLQLAEDFSDDEEEPLMAFRGNDRDFDDEGDEDEFAELDDEAPDWDDWEELEEEDDPIFDELGNIPAPRRR